MSDYCPGCHHPWGYHDERRGCTMPLNQHGSPVSSREVTVRSCRCTESPDQLPLWEPDAVARTSDPDTSHDAAASIDHIRKRQAAVLATLRALGPSTDEAMVAAYPLHQALPQSPSGLRTRRHELEVLGLVEWTGEKRPLLSGRMARVWRATTPPEGVTP